MTDLFVSYKSEDRARVAPLVAALEADGITVWWDAHIGSGSSWRESIETNLNEARCVLVVWSERSVGSEGSFVRDEATRSLRRGAYFPVRIDLVEPPLGFGETQAASLIGWKGDRADARYQEVLSAVQAVIAGKPRPIPLAYKPKRTVDRRLVLGGGVAAVALAGAGGWWALHRASPPDDSVAVLPFENLSGDPTQAYFSDGIAEELRGALARLASLKVAARTSSELMRDADAPTAAAKLGVANILTGSVNRGADMIRINAQLIDGVSGLVRWSDVYNRAIGDAITIQTGIAESVAGALQIALGKAQKALLTVGGTTNPAAQDAYLQGRAHNAKNEQTPALAAFDAAIAADPNFALAHTAKVEIAVSLAQQSLGGAALRAKLDVLEAEVRRAIASTPGLGSPISTLGRVLEVRLDLRGADDAYSAGFRTQPGEVPVLGRKAVFDSKMGRPGAVALLQRAITLDPLRPIFPMSMSGILLNLGQFDAALERARAGVAALPDSAVAKTGFAFALLAKGMAAEALKAGERIAADDDDHAVVLAAATARTDRSASDRALAALTGKTGKTGDTVQYQIAEVHAWRGEADLAFAAIGRAWELRDSLLIGLKTDFFLAPIRADPRFGEWVRKIGFP